MTQNRMGRGLACARAKLQTPSLAGLIVCLLTLFLTATFMHAQTAVDGAIGGTVLDTTGAVVPNAAVTVLNDGTNAEQKAVTDGSGYFRVIHLQPGRYTVTVTSPGFDTFKSSNLSVEVGLLTDPHVRLKIGSTTQTVQVTDEAPLVNTTSPDFAGAVEEHTLQNLPENNYRWSAFALLTPGVVNDKNGYGLLSFRGQSTLLNNVTIDGTDDNEAFWSEERGRTRAGYSTIKAAVQEFQVNTSNYSVEYGRSAGGIVNAVSKSGTNHLHGQAYYFDRDGAWAAENPNITHPVEVSTNPITYSVVPFKPTDLRRQYGFEVGGPILINKVFFLLAADRFYHDFPAAATILGTSANSNFYTVNGSFAKSQIAQIVTDTGLSTSAATTVYDNGITGLTTMLGSVPRVGDQTIYFPKIDWQLNQKNHVSVEANRMRWTSPAGIQTSPAVAYGMRSFGNDYVRDSWMVGKLDSFITPALSNEARYMYSRDFEYEFNQAPTSYEENNLVKTSNYTNPLGLPTNVYLSGFFQFGTPQFLNRAALPDERRWQLADTVEWIRGNHQLKFGEDYLHTDDNISNLYNQYGGYTYSGNTALGNYLADLYLSQNPTQGYSAENYNFYDQGAGLPGLEFTTGDYAFFVQDEWKAKPRLSLTMGIRWEYEQFPKQLLPNPAVPQTLVMPTYKGDIGPRVGFAYDVFGKGRTILRGGYGEFFARAINSTIYQALIGSGNSQGQTNPRINPGTSCAPQFPQVVPPSAFSTCLGGSSGNTTAVYFDPNFKVPEIQQADLTVEQQLSNSDVFSVSWLGSWGRRLPDFVDTNLPAPTPVTFAVDDSTDAGPLANGATVKANAFFYTTNPNHRPNPNFSSMTDIFSGVTSNYEAIVAEYKHRMSHFVSFDVNYTWSHALDYGENNTTGASATALLDPTNIRLDYGNSNQNVPDRLVIYTVGDSPWHLKGPVGYLVNDFEIAPDFQTQSGLPYSAGFSGASAKLYPTGATTQQSIVTTGSFNGSGGDNVIPGIDRNNFRSPLTWFVDLRVSKSIAVRERYKLEFLTEAFNLTNHQNVTGVGSTAYVVSENTTTHANLLTPYTSTPFTSVTSTDNSNFAYNIRQVQMALRFTF